MKLPFSHDQFVEVFKNYNEAVFPLQAIFFLVAIITVFLAIGETRRSSLLALGVLSFFWLWMGLAYHLTFFRVINPAANLFGVLFIIQSILFGLFSRRVNFRLPTDAIGATGLVIVFIALSVYPSIGYLLGHTYPYAPTFGVPCPTTIFTFGILLLTNKKCPLILLIIPGLWSIIGLFAALSMGFYEDIALVMAGLIAIPVLVIRQLRRNWRYSPVLEEKAHI